ncbi:hypothetical protein CLM84_14230, partial [Streptomyces albidoflavus]
MAGTAFVVPTRAATAATHAADAPIRRARRTGHPGRRAAVRVALALTLVPGVAYPLAVTGVAHVAFPSQADGSLVDDNGRVVASGLIGQEFTL